MRRWLILLIGLVVLAMLAAIACGGDDDDDNDDNDTGDDDAGDDDDTGDDDSGDDDAGDDDSGDDDTGDDDTTPVGFETGVSFDGVDGYAYAADSASLNPAQNITVEAWVLLPETLDWHVAVIDKQGAPLAKGKASQGGYRLGIDEQGYPSFCANVGGSTTCAEVATAMAAGQWYHLAGVYDRAAGEVRAYLDGGDAAVEDAGVGDIADTAPELWIARHVPSQATYDQFDVDEIRISGVVRYTGTAFAVPDGAFEPDAGTLALWHFDEGEGTAVADESANGNDLTLSGGATWVDHD